MKQAVLGYDQKFFINGTQVSGVQNVNGSYAIPEKPINILGWGHVNRTYYDRADAIMQTDATSFILNDEGFNIIQENSCPPESLPYSPSLTVLNAPLEGQFSINSTLVSEDFMLRFTGDNPFTGSIHHGNKYFGFSSGYITNHSVSCSVGQIPTTSTSIKIFGDVGGSPDYIAEEPMDDSVILQEDSYPIVAEEGADPPYYNASGNNPFPTIRVPNQGSIILECTGANTDRVTAFTHSIETPISPIYIVGSSMAAQIDVLWPISTTSSFTLEVDKYNYQRMRQYLIAPTVQDIAVKINDCFGDTIQNYVVNNARLIGEQMSASSEGRLTVNLQYKSYYNKR